MFLKTKEIFELIKWSRQNYSHLPWRIQRTPFSTYLSEIMLQQTTVNTVIDKYRHYLEKLPNVKDWAHATEEDVLKIWSGLGYYRRAKLLKKSCEILENYYGGQVPQTKKELRELPGVGEYTANAILAFAFAQKELPIDANLERIFSRLFVLEESGEALKKKIKLLFEKKELFDLKISGQEFSFFVEALMDLGREICGAKMAKCEICFLKENCQAFQNNQVFEYPKKDKVKTEKHKIILGRFVIKKKDGILLYKKNAKEWLQEQYELPTVIISSSDNKIKQYPFLKKINYSEKFVLKSAITKYSIENRIYKLTEKEFFSLGLEDYSRYGIIYPKNFKSLALGHISKKILNRFDGYDFTVK